MATKKKTAKKRAVSKRAKAKRAAKRSAKPKRGRPYLGRHTMISSRFDEKEMARIGRAAKKAGVSLSRWQRDIALKAAA